MKMRFWRAELSEADGSCPPLRPRGTRPTNISIDNGDLIRSWAASMKHSIESLGLDSARERREFLRVMAFGLVAGPAVLPCSTLVQDTANPARGAQPLPGPGMPGPFPGQIVEVKSRNVISNYRVNSVVVSKMIELGMMELTGAATPLKAWQTFVNKDDVVAIKVNASGLPYCVSSPEIILEIIRALNEVGIPPQHIYLYERYTEQLDLVGYYAYVPERVRVVGLDGSRLQLGGFDKDIYAERSFFGEEETRSYLATLLSQVVTKIINVPNLKDHSAAGVTGCLKNIGYGSFDNVARSHKIPTTQTKIFIGQLCSMEPLRSKTVLQIMDGLRGVYHGGPFARNRNFIWYPGLIYVGTDPVAIDRIELDVVEAKRKEVGAVSLWDRSPENLAPEMVYVENPRKNLFIREPEHIQYAGSLGLGVYELEKIKFKQIIVT